MRPNILYIHSHDTGRYIQPYGYAIPTPNLQRLAEEGVLFRKAFCGAPTCSPSRACLLTGQSAHNSGMLGLAHRGFQLTDYNQHIIHTLKKAGYENYLAGVQHIADQDSKIGYDAILTRDGFHNKQVGAVVPQVENFLHQRRNENNQTPFFLSVGFVETHREFWKASWQEDERYTIPPAPLPDTPETRRDMSEFKASARIYDQGVGTILKTLDELCYSENTLVICTTDHGIPFPGMKCSLTDHGIGVMLIMRGPRGFKGGKVIDAMVSHLDLFPTICDMLEIDKPTWLQGSSLLPLFEENQSEIHDAIFADVTFHAAYEPKRAVRTSRFKYIRRFEERKNPILPNCDDGYSKDVLLENNWADRENDTEMLFDLIFDPNESHNLINDKTYSDVADQIRDRLFKWMNETEDPLLGNLPIQPPHGAMINSQDQLSPNAPVIIIN